MAIESSFKNMVITLFTVCLVASAALGGIYAVTQEPIAAAQTAKINAAIGGVVPEFNNAPSEEKYTVDVDGKVATIYPAKKDGQIVGYAVEASTSKGFGGTIIVMVGFTPEGAVVNTSVISHAETPGLGAKIDDATSHFITQFNGRNPGEKGLVVTKDGGDIDAITASTITSRAYCDVVENAYKAYAKAAAADAASKEVPAEQTEAEVTETNASEEAQVK